MGTLLGHTLPGSFFILFSLWRLLQTIRRLQMIRAAYRWGLLPPAVRRGPRGPGRYPGGPAGSSPCRTQTTGAARDSCSSCFLQDGQLRNHQDVAHREEHHCDDKIHHDDNTKSRIHDDHHQQDNNHHQHDEYHQHDNDHHRRNTRWSTDRARDNDDDENDDDDNSQWTYFTSASYPCYFCCFTRWPLEAIVKLLATSVGMAGELAASTDWGRAGRILWMGDIQHVTMYGFFFLSGLVDLLGWFRVAFLPRGLDFLTLAQAFAGEYLLFRNHNHGADELERQLHSRLILVIACIILTILLEYKYPRSLPASLSTTFFMFLQGTWFIQVGLILYPPYPDWYTTFSSDSSLTSLAQLMVADMVFAWHIAGGFILLAFLFLMISRLLERTATPSRWEASDRSLVKSCAAEVILATVSPSVCRRRSVTSCDADHIELTSLMTSSDCCHDETPSVACASCRVSAGDGNSGTRRAGNRWKNGGRKTRERHDSMSNLMNDDDDDVGLWSDDDDADETNETVIYTKTAAAV